jgi:hypothetical protein
MKQKILTAIALFALGLATMLVTASIVSFVRSDLAIAQVFKVPARPSSDSWGETGNFEQGIPASCALKPENNLVVHRSPTSIDLGSLTLDRFRRDVSNLDLSPTEPANSLGSSKTFESYTPRESIALANPTNYGQRYVLDLSSRPAYHDPIIVLHETVFSARSAINTFRTPQYNESKQVSYHTLITLNGDIVYLVPPDLRAYGAGNSVFKGENGIEAVKTHPNYPPSVNNFAYHVSLETPVDGRNNRSRHSGYTLAQYRSLAWLVAKTGVPDSRITTHKGVDRSGLRKDPRSFNSATFFRFLQSFPRSNEISIGCQPSSDNR